MKKIALLTGLALVSTVIAGSALAYDVKKVLEKATYLQKTRGYVSNHVEGGHTHFDLKAHDGSVLEICPHPKMGLLHVMQGDRIPGLRSVVEINLKNEVTPYNGNPFTTVLHRNSHSKSGLRHLANKGMRAIMETKK